MCSSVGVVAQILFEELASCQSAPRDMASHSWGPAPPSHPPPPWGPTPPSHPPRGRLSEVRKRSAEELEELIANYRSPVVNALEVISDVFAKHPMGNTVPIPKKRPRTRECKCDDSDWSSSWQDRSDDWPSSWQGKSLVDWSSSWHGKSEWSSRKDKSDWSSWQV